jgi:predicted transcriptional regulator YdeE
MDNPAPRLTAQPARRIVGIALATDNTQAFQTIPAHWQRLGTESVLDRIAHRQGQDVFAVYSQFENLEVLHQPSGIAQLRYTLVIGAEVAAGTAAPQGMVAVDVPAQRCAVFDVPAGRADWVGARWQEIWSLPDLPRAVVADVERYHADGRIEILVGLR